MPERKHLSRKKKGTGSSKNNFSQPSQFHKDKAADCPPGVPPTGTESPAAGSSAASWRRRRTRGAASPAEGSTSRRAAPGSTAAHGPPCSAGAKAPIWDKLGRPSLTPPGAGRCWSEGSNWTPVSVGSRSAVAAGRSSMVAAGSWSTVPEAPKDRLRMTQVVVAGMPPPGSWCTPPEALGRRYMTRVAAGTR
jgi:hypothetical protein